MNKKNLFLLKLLFLSLLTALLFNNCSSQNEFVASQKEFLQRGPASEEVIIPNPIIKPPEQPVIVGPDKPEQPPEQPQPEEQPPERPQPSDYSFYLPSEKLAVQQQKATLLFATSYSGSTRVEKGQGTRLLGSDSSVPLISNSQVVSNFSLLFGSPDAGSLLNRLLRGANFGLAKGGSVDIVSDPVSANQQDKVLKFKAIGPLTSKARVQLNITPKQTGDLREFTHFARIFIPRDLEQLATNFPCEIEWLTLFEMFTNNNVARNIRENEPNPDFKGQLRFGLSIQKEEASEVDSRVPANQRVNLSYCNNGRRMPSAQVPELGEPLWKIGHKGYKPKPFYFNVEYQEGLKDGSSNFSSLPLGFRQPKALVPLDEWFTIAIYFKANRPHRDKAVGDIQAQDLDGEMKIVLIRDQANINPAESSEKVETVLFERSNFKTMLLATPDPQDRKIEPAAIFIHKLYTDHGLVNLMTEKAPGKGIEFYFDDWRFYKGRAL